MEFCISTRKIAWGKDYVPKKEKLTEKNKERIEELLHIGRPREAQGLSISQWISRETGIPERTIAAYIANLSRNKNGVLIIETTFESKELKSESKHLKELLRIYDWNGAIKARSIKIHSKRDFLEALKKAKEWTVHISAHGKYIGNNRTILGTGIWSKTSSDELRELWIRENHEPPKLIVISACEAGHQDMASALSDAGCRYFIAPMHKTLWFDAAVFNTLFYYYYFLFGRSPCKAFKKTMHKVRGLSGAWSCFKDGKKIRINK